MLGRRFRALRIGVLLVALAGVVAFAYADTRSRQRRNEWAEPLVVGLVLLDEGSVDPAAVEALRARLPALEAELAHEHSRYRPGASIHFELFGPVHASSAPPQVQEGLWGLVRYTWDLRRYVRAVDDAVHLDADRFDSRVYATIRPPETERRTHVEGQSEQNGRIAVVRVELDVAMVDLALIVVTHELLHTLGAVDKYDAEGRTLVPGGLADPAQEPRYPQAKVEVMARNRPVSPDQEVVPTTLTELGVGPDTAREIGWSP